MTQYSNPVVVLLRRIKWMLFGKPETAYPNENIRRYYELSAERAAWKAMPKQDDFNWELYNIHYRGELEAISKEHTLHLSPGDYTFSEGQLSQQNTDILPLHPNWHILYETMLQLAPESAFEIGCGNGMHLMNMETLAPGLRLGGLDRSEDQIKFLRECSPSLKAEIQVRDATMPLRQGEIVADICYSQAVIMHMNTNNNHLEALKNMFRIAQRQVLFVENWTHHPFLADVLTLYKAGETGWPAMHLYFRVSLHTPETKVMICSKTPLPYAELTDYGQLL